MSVNLRTLKAYRLTDFSGGLNEFDSSFTMNDNELQEATNVELRTGGAVRTRLGAPIYQRQAFSSIVAPVKNLFRYTRFNGEKKVLAYSGSTVYRDDDNGEFVSMQSSVTSDDGYCRFSQWREAALYGTATSAVYAHAPDQEYPSFAANIVRIDLSGTYKLITTAFPDNYITLTAFTSGIGALAGGFWEYRFTFDMYCGTTFLGETAPLSFFSVNGNGKTTSWSASQNVIGPNDAVNISLSADPRVFEAEYSFATIGAINVYRQILPTVGGTIIETEIEPNMAWVGAIPREKFSVLGVTHIIDRGLFAGRSIAPFYARATPPPRGRFNVIHKSRLWVGSVQYPVPPTSNNDVAGQYDAFFFTSAPHRVYFSEVNEIGAFLGTSWVEIDPLDGDGITGMASYKNKALIVFKSNAMWVVAGGDDEIGPGIPDISIENISTDIGCVAPESIQVCEGRVVWLSHRGVYYYDGTIPKPLKTENIDETLLVRPGTKYDEASSAFLVKEREYWLSHSDDGSYNNLLSKFSFKNSSWVRGDIGVGVASMVEKKSMDKPPVLLAGVEASSGTMSADTAVRYLEQGGYDGASSAISWAWKTKFLDFRAPMVDKKYVAVLVQLTSTTDVTMQVYCDNHLDGESFTILKTENDQDIDSDDLVWADDAGTIGGEWSDGTTEEEWAGTWTRNALVYLNTKCWGKRIALRFSGTSTAEPTEIQAVTIFYDSKEGVRQ